MTVTAPTTAHAKAARNIARTWLNWFEQDAVSPGNTVLRNRGSDYACRYRDEKTGRIVNAMDYVRDLATARITDPKSRVAICDAAANLLNGN